MREQCIVGLLSMAMGVAACALLDKYEYDRIDLTIVTGQTEIAMPECPYPTAP